MLLFYIDEFGDHSVATAPDDPTSLKAGVSEWFVLGSVGVRDTSRKPLAEAIFELKRKHFGEGIDLDPWDDSEIKGRYLFRVARSTAAGKKLKRPSAYQTLDKSDKVTNLIDDLDLLFAKFRPLIFAVAVDKRALLELSQKASANYEVAPPLGASYAYLQQRVAFTMEQVFAGDSAMLVADQQVQHEQYFMSGEMNDVRDGLTENLPLQPNFDLVLDKPLWIDTNLSSWDREILQLADIVAYSVGVCVREGQPPEWPCYLWPRIESLMAVHWSTGRVEAGGFSIYPKPKNYPIT